MRARHRSAWMEGALFASLSLVFAAAASANQNAPAANQEEGCSSAGVVHFAHASSKLNGQAKKSLNDIADQVRDNDALKVRVEAFTDPTGTVEANQILSEKRAVAVESYLQRKGIDPDRVTVAGRGEAPSAEERPASSERVAVVSTCKAAEQAEAPPAPVEETPAPAPEAEAPPPPPPVETAPAPAPAPAEMASAEGVHAQAYEPKPVSGIGIGITAGAGVMDFTQQRARSFTDPGVTWGVTATFGTRLPVALDVSYVGSSQNINLAGFSSDSYLLGQGVNGDLRIQYPKGWVRPYIFGGIGWRQMSIKRQNVFGTGFLDFDNQGTVPFGAGLAIGQVNGIMFDLHGTGTVTFDDEMLSGVLQNQGERSHMNTWDVTARIGGEF
jgi:hypothetical protein